MFPTGDQTVPALGFVSSVSTAKARLHRYNPKSDRGSSSPTDGPGIRETRDHTLAPVQAPMGTSCPLLPVSDPWPSLNMVKDYNKAVIVLLFFFSFLQCCVGLYHTTLSSVQFSHSTRQTFVCKAMSLLFNILSRLVITFLPRSKCVFISWLQ